MKKSLILLATMCSIAHVMSDNIHWCFPSTTLSSVTNNASDPLIGMDANGNVVAVWVENSNVKASTKTRYGHWSASQTLSSLPASEPALVVSQEGDATAVWLENGVVKSASKPFNQNWNSAVALSSSGATSPDIAVDTAGDVVAVWVRNNNVETATKLIGANWQNPVSIQSTAPSSPHVAMGGTGSATKAVVVWSNVVGSTSFVYSTRKSIPGNWIASVVISDSTRNAAYPHVAVDGNGNASAVWYQYDVNNGIYSNVVVQSASRTAAGNWTAPYVLSAPGLYNPASLSAVIGFDANGNALALWSTSFDGETFDIQSAVKPILHNWNAPVEIVNSLYSLGSDLAVSSLGDALALYMFYNGSALQIQSAETNLSGFIRSMWSVPLGVSSGPSNGFPRVAATLNGNLINTAAIWIDSNGTTNTIQATTGLKSVVLPPCNPSVVQQAHNFGFYVDYTNNISWNASIDPRVVGYVIFRNGVFIGKVDANMLYFADSNQGQNQAVTYGVAAINNQNEQSNIINATFP